MREGDVPQNTLCCAVLLRFSFLVCRGRSVSVCRTARRLCPSICNAIFVVLWDAHACVRDREWVSDGKLMCAQRMVIVWSMINNNNNNGAAQTIYAECVFHCKLHRKSISRMHNSIIRECSSHSGGHRWLYIDEIKFKGEKQMLTIVRYLRCVIFFFAFSRSRWMCESFHKIFLALIWVVAWLTCNHCTLKLARCRIG